jgi:hypothetical protein
VPQEQKVQRSLDYRLLWLSLQLQAGLAPVLSDPLIRKSGLEIALAAIRKQQNTGGAGGDLMPDPLQTHENGPRGAPGQQSFGFQQAAASDSMVAVLLIVFPLTRYERFEFRQAQRWRTRRGTVNDVPGLLRRPAQGYRNDS